jgi:hypothetical protein
MRNLALSVAAILVLAVASPAFAQPFADVPTDHWAFDAIAELAAKGIIEGFPDGTFKGDRGVSRYEVAIIVARILARIEAIKIPAPAPAAAPQVTRTDVQTIQRLVNEFRAELAALGVRTTAVEEELAALKAATSSTKVTGELDYRYSLGPSIGPGGGAGLGTSWGVALLTFVGKTGGATGTVRLNLGNQGGVFALGGTTATSTSGVEGSFDRAQLEFPYFGMNWRVGRQTYQLGPVGLLFQEGWVGCAACLGVDGLVVNGSFAGVGFEAASFLHLIRAPAAPVNPPAPIAGDTTPTMAHASFNFSGWTVGAGYYYESQASAVTTNTGYEVDLTGALFPGFSLTGEWATFTPSGAAAQTAYQATLGIDVAGMMGGGLNPKLSVWYKNYPLAWGPIWPGSCEAICSTIFQDLQSAFGGQLTLNMSDAFRPYVKYETGTRTGPPAGTLTEYEVGFRSKLTSSVDARIRYQNRSNVGATDRDRYRVELFYSW